MAGLVGSWQLVHGDHLHVFLDHIGLDERNLKSLEQKKLPVLDIELNADVLKVRLIDQASGNYREQEFSTKKKETLELDGIKIKYTVTLESDTRIVQANKEPYDYDSHSKCVYEMVKENEQTYLKTSYDKTGSLKSRGKWIRREDT